MGLPSHLSFFGYERISPNGMNRDNCDKDKPLSDPIKVDVIESLYWRDDSVVTGVRFTYASGTTHMRFIIHYDLDERTCRRR